MSPPDPLHEFFRDVTAFGGMSFYIVVLLLTLLFQQYAVFWNLTIGFLIILTCVVLIRIVYFKARPRPQDHHNYLQRLDASSFPSLHTARIFFAAFYFSYVWNRLYSTIILLTIALSVSYSRIYLQKHDWWDVLGGIALAGITATLMMVV